jgi:hypothetical protein
MLKNKKRVDEVAITYVVPSLLQEIFRAGNTKKASILNASFPGERSSRPHHSLGDIYAHSVLEMTGERKHKSPDTAPQFQAKNSPHLVQLEEREKLLLNRASSTLPEFASVVSLQCSQDIGVRIFLRKLLPLFGGTPQERTAVCPSCDLEHVACAAGQRIAIYSVILVHIHQLISSNRL